MIKKCLALLLVTALAFTACSPEEEQLPDWRVNPTAIIDAGLALDHVAWYFELMEFPAGAFYAYADSAEITAVTPEGSRISGFAVYLNQPLWTDDVNFFLVTRDERLFYNIGGEEVRAGVYLVHRFETESLSFGVSSVEEAIAIVAEATGVAEEFFINTIHQSGFEDKLWDGYTADGLEVFGWTVSTNAFYEPVDFFLVTKSGSIYFQWALDFIGEYILFHEFERDMFTPYDESLFSLPTWTAIEIIEYLDSLGLIFSDSGSPNLAPESIPPLETIRYSGEIIEGYYLRLIAEPMPRTYLYHVTADGSVYVMFNDSRHNDENWRKAWDGGSAPAAAPPADEPANPFSGEMLSGDTYEMPIAAGWVYDDDLFVIFSPDETASISIFSEALLEDMTEEDYLEFHIQYLEEAFGVEVSVLGERHLGGEAGTLLMFFEDDFEYLQQINIKDNTAHIVFIIFAGYAYEDDVTAMVDAFRFK
jgi:hypothetical protein